MKKKQTRSRTFLKTAVLVLFLLGGVHGNSVSATVTLPALPQTYIDTTYSAPTGTTCMAANSSTFQACLDNAALNSTIVLQAGTTYMGPFTLPNKTSGSGWIYIVSSNLANLPAPGNRVGPVNAVNMPKIQAGSSSADRAVLTVNNSHHYRFVGIEFKPQTGVFNTALIYLDGGSISNPSLLPNNFTFDRCYIHGDSTVGGRRGIYLNATSVAVIDSYLSDFKEVGADTQTIMSANSPGPVKIFNNYLEATGENVMFGGQDPSITNLVPSDIEIKRNYFFKPLSWRSGPWSVKNLLEFKNARRILIEGNIFENSWSADQDGTAILITPKNQNNTAPWTTTEDITIRYNRIKNANVGVRMCGSNCDPTPTQVQNRVHIHNNEIQIDTALGYSNTGLFSLLKDVTNLTINHNTGIIVGSSSSKLMIQNSGTPHPDYLDFRNNIVSNGMYGWKGDGIAGGEATLDAYFAHYEFFNNAVIGASSGYPTTTYYPTNISAIGFVDYTNGNYRLSISSPYKNAGTDGKDLGADIDALDAAIACTTDGQCGQTSTTPTSCSTLTTPTDWTNDPNHTGYGTPYDLFNNNTSIVQADCTPGSPTTLNLSIGNTTDPTLFSLMSGYYWNGSDWTPYTTSTCSGNQSGSWCQGETTGTITSTSINTSNSTTPQYFLGFTCKYTGSLPWKCGCQDTACTTPSWQLQGAALP